MTDPPRLEIAIALVFRGAELLVTRRPEHVHLGGFWEFPGGKLRAGETALACAEREVAEETALSVRALSERTPIAWDYPERRVLLRPVNCAWLAGTGEAREVAELRWILPSELGTLVFPPANAGLVAELRAERR
jgi:8-oxo-dGTP diphosphatase